MKQIRSILDQYYTKKEVANYCYKKSIQKLKDLKVNIQDYMFLEPSAGLGSFYNLFPLENRIGLDLYPLNSDIIKIDFFNWKHDVNKKYIAIGNPPFGRQSCLAFKFLKKCSTFCDFIFFILPKSFKKASYLTRVKKMNLDLFFYLDLKEKSFLLNGLEYDVPCSFFMFQKKQYIECKKEKINLDKIKFVKKQENPDFSIRRVGYYAGKLDNYYLNKNENTHYYIKLSLDKNIFFNKYNKLVQTFDFNNTVGPRSISKLELIEIFKKIC